MSNYFVLIREDNTKEVSSTICQSNSEVATLLEHLDTTKFSIIKIEEINSFVSDINQFCSKNKSLETGLKEEVKND